MSTLRVATTRVSSPELPVTGQGDGRWFTRGPGWGNGYPRAVTPTDGPDDHAGDGDAVSGTVGRPGIAVTLEEMRIEIDDDRDILTARQEGRRMAARIGLAPTDLTLVATAISELARNIVLYADHGEIVLRLVRVDERRALVVLAIDGGPGIANLAQALRDGYSTSGGLGLGLPAVRRLMDDFDIVSSPGHGTTVTFRKYQR